MSAGELGMVVAAIVTSYYFGWTNGSLHQLNKYEKRVKDIEEAIGNPKSTS